MKTGRLAALVALGVALVAIPVVIGADEIKTQKADTAPTEKVTVYSVRCDDPCPFSVQSTDKQEVAEIVAQHARTHHQMNVTAKDCETMIKTHQVMVRTGEPMKGTEGMMKKTEPPQEKPNM